MKNMAYKKTALITSIVLSSSLALAACGDDTQVTEPVGDETVEEQPTAPEDASPEGGVDQDSIGGETFGFTEFELDVDYPDEDDVFDVSYEEDRDAVEAEYENKRTGQDLSGNDAMRELEPIFGGLDFDVDTPDDEVISQVVEAFEIEEGYSSLEIEVRFPDGTEKEYTDGDE
jgi:hypothetical protein